MIIPYLMFFFINSRTLFCTSVLPSISERLVSSNYSIQNVCLTPGCFRAAAEVLSNVDENVDPCEDFYRFACGGWMDKRVIPKDKPYLSVFSKLEDGVNLKLRALLEEKLDGSEPAFVKMVKEFYDACTDEEAIEKAGSEPLKKVLKSLGGWPVIEGSHWNDSNFDWIQMLASFRKLGLSHNILLYLTVIFDRRNITVHRLAFFELPSSVSRGLNDSGTAAYFKLMVKSAKLLGADEKTAEDELLKALDFEIALTNLPRKQGQSMSELNKKCTVKELQEAVPQIPWLKYFNAIIDHEIYENETLVVSIKEYLKNVAELISRTDKRVLANYMVWRAINQHLLLFALSKDWRDLHHEYLSVRNGKTEEPPRRERCFSTATQGFGAAVSSYYVRHYFKEETKVGVSELVKYIRKEFSNVLENIDWHWMDEQTKEKSKAKADNMQAFVGYPTELLNDTAVLEYYQDLKISNESHYENIMRLHKWSIDYGFFLLREPYIRGDWKMHVPETKVAASYKRLENSIDFPPPFLQKPFFDKDRPRYMNFGAIGFLIGHLISQGVYSIGRQLDKDGNNVDWAHNPGVDEYLEKKAQCLIDQYSNYTAENGMKLNGVNTRRENIADHEGMKEAYRAYHSWVKDNGPEQLLPGLDYSQTQLFWISTANVFCIKYGPEYLKQLINSGRHSPNQFRINGTMSNLAEFAKDFNCSPELPMNKQPKCKVW